MIDIDYTFYKDRYFGGIIPDQKALIQPVMKANIYLSQLVHQEIQDANQEDLVKLCLCEVSELIYQDAKNRESHGGKDVQAENSDGYSVTYASENGNSSMGTLGGKVYGTIRKYLSRTGLL